MSQNKTPTDSGVGFIDGVWHGPKAWQCQCGRPYTVTCISSKPPKKEWVGLTDEEIQKVVSKKWWDWEDSFDIEGFSRAIERVLKEKNHG